MTPEYLPEIHALQPLPQNQLLTVRDVVATGFRHRRTVTVVFSGVMLIAFLVALLWPRSYEAHLRILVKNGRVDPVVSPEANVTPPQPREADMEQALNSEAELLKSQDLLEQVVVATGLNRRAGARFGLSDRERQLSLALATRKLASDLRVEPISKTNIVEVSYESPQPKLAAEVLNTLANLYLQKHVELHQTPGQYSFFSQLAEGYRKQLLEAEAKLVASGQVAPNLLRDMTVQKYNDATATLAQTNAAIQETEKRMGGLKKQAAATPPRVVTQIHRADNQALLQQLKTTLLNLRLKRTELLTKFQPTYRLVREVDKEISDTAAAIEREQNAPAREQTTDANPTHAWMDSEIAKARADLVTLKARQAATEQIVLGYEGKLKQLEQESIANDDLQRAANTAKENYTLYVRKAEEARISEALDRNRILNVAIAESATIPILPSNSRFEYLLVGLFLATAGSLGFVLAAHYIDSRYYRTPDEVVRSLQLPVLAAIPAEPQQPTLAETSLRRAGEQG